MALGVRLELRRRLHSLRPRHRLVGGDRGGAAPPLCRDDARERRARAYRSAALLCPRAAEEWRPQRLREPHPFHSARAAQAFRAPDLARGRAGALARGERRPAGRSSGADAGDVAMSSINESFLTNSACGKPARTLKIRVRPVTESARLCSRRLTRISRLLKETSWLTSRPELTIITRLTMSSL